MRLFGLDINIQRREVQSVPASTADSGKQQAATAGVHGASYEANIVYARSPQVALWSLRQEEHTDEERQALEAQYAAWCTANPDLVDEIDASVPEPDSSYE